MEDRPPDRRVRRRIAEVCAALNSAGAKYIVAGGAACVIHGYEVDGVTVPLLSLDDLIASKRSGRPLDQADVEALEQLKRLRAARGET